MKLLNIKILCFGFFVLMIAHGAFAQVEFMQRVEVLSEWDDHDFIVLPQQDGTISFRTKAGKGFSLEQKLQYFVTDLDLQAESMYEVPVKDYFQLTGFDLEDSYLYTLFQKGESYANDRIIYEVNLLNHEVREVVIENVLDMELQEFLIMDKKAILMGMMDYRPAIQVFDTETKEVFTVQGVYANEVNILQLSKKPELEVFEVLVTKKNRFKERSLSVMTFDTDGNMLREVKVAPEDRPELEITDGVISPADNYNQVLIGPYGLRKRDPDRGIYFTRINEFGEYSNRFYTLADFDNFYNFLPEKQRAKKEKSLEKAIEKDKDLVITNTLTTREVLAGPDYFLVYNDYFLTSSGRYSPRDLLYANDFYRYAPMSMRNRVMPGGYPWYFPGGRASSSYEYKYMAAQFLMLDAEGNMIWDNSISLDDVTLGSPGKFGEVSFDGNHLYYLYLEDSHLKMSHLQGGEVDFINMDVPINLPNGEERIKETQEESLTLSWWYRDYFLLSGKQKVRYINKDNREEIREVYFLTKIRADASLIPKEEEEDEKKE